ncbi:HAD hydrolase family protein [Terrisporobacter glycolicus]|uniref:HAD hydrolase family protein n=1 Tax=Terrisporobacter glycolicus TaxID=36841 RepID=UPI000CDEA444
MVIFSDLDRSIIYSSKFLKDISENSYECIELKDNKEISYVSLKTMEILKTINENTLFIPTTTRTRDQFERINFNKYNINFDYAITSNGGYILKNNRPLLGWQEEVEKIKKSSESIDVMLDLFEPYTKMNGVTNFRVAENLFFYIVVDFKEFDIMSIYTYISILNNKNWIYYVSGRKIYFLPKGITKESAIEYICKVENIESFAVIGDSNMDRGMLNITDNAYVLKHGDINTNDIEGEFIRSMEEGIKGTEEVLLNLLEKISL